MNQNDRRTSTNGTSDRNYFMVSERIGFSTWKPEDIELARLLWGDPDVTKLICASGVFSGEEIENRLKLEIENEKRYQIQYWPIFDLESGELIGCCGLRPREQDVYEIGFHLRPTFWGTGYASEAAQTVIRYAFEELHALKLFAGHNPKNLASKYRLLSLGFQYIGDEFYAPTGLYHPSYEMKNPDL